jgi:hypothetical protein
LAFETSQGLGQDHVAAVVKAEILTDPVRAERHAELLRRCLVPPQLVGCLAAPAPGRPPFALTRLWLVFEEPDAWGDRQFIAFDQHHGSFHLGFLGLSGYRALVLGRSGGFFRLLDMLTSAGR